MRAALKRLVVLQHVEREGPGLFALEALARGWTVLISRLDLGDPLPQLGNADCLLVFGGLMGVWPIWACCLPLGAGGTAVPLKVGDPPCSCWRWVSGRSVGGPSRSTSSCSRDWIPINWFSTGTEIAACFLQAPRSWP